MANKKSKKSGNKNLIYCICGVVAVAVVAIVVAVVFLTSNKPIDDSFFVSDDTKYVLTMNANVFSGQTGEYMPEKIRMVYFYSGDKVTDLKMYYEYEDEEIAKKAADYLKTVDMGEEIADIAVNGKYVIATANKSTFEQMTADDAKQQVELMEMLQNMDLDDYNMDDEEE